MSDSRRKLPSLVELFVVIGVVVGLVAVLNWVVQHGRNPKGPHGEMIPTNPPDEANRIRHATGLSIIAPENWDQGHDWGPDIPFLQIEPRGMPGARSKSFLCIQEMNVPGENILRDSTRLTFQGFPAYERMEIDREWSLDDPAKSSYDLYVDRDGEWWHIMFGVPDEMHTFPSEIRQFLDTIEFPRQTASESKAEHEEG